MSGSKESTSERHLVPAQSGLAIRVGTGATVRIVDLDGSQVADVFAFNTADPSEWMSPSHTRTVARKLFPMPGERFFTNRYRPAFSFVADDSAGLHDMLYPACEPAMYRRLGVEGYHPSCRENYNTAVVATWADDYPSPDPVNIFQNSPVDREGNLLPGAAMSKPGDSITLRAELDVLLVVTACSQDIVAINGDRCTPIQIEVRSP